MKRLHKYLVPSFLTLPTYLGFLCLFLLFLLLSFELQDRAYRMKEPQREQVIPEESMIGDKPTGKIYASLGEVNNHGGSITFTADAKAKEGQVEYVRYYLLNPSLGVNNDWGGPNWCSCGRVCALSDKCSLKTWDLGESADSKRRYQIMWGPETTSGISTQVSRKLNPVNVPPGEYLVYIQVKDTAGNINEAADTMKIRVLGEQNVLGDQAPSQIVITSCGNENSEQNAFFSWDESSDLTSHNHFYQLDQGEWNQVYGNAITLAVDGGDHTFTLQAVDQDNQVVSTRCSFQTK